MFKKVLAILRNQEFYRFLLGSIFMGTVSHASDLDEHYLTPEKFASLADQIVNLDDYNVSKHQEKLISNPKESSLGYYVTQTDLFRKIADNYLIDIRQAPKFTKSYLLAFMEENDDASKIRGIVSASTSDYDFNLTLTVFNAPEIIIKVVPSPQGAILAPNISVDWGFCDKDKKEKFMDRFDKLAGTIRCKWSKTDDISLLTVNTLTVNPYSISESGIVIVSALERNEQTMPYEGLVQMDYENRLNKLEIFLEQFAFEIAKVDRIQLMKNELNSKAIEILSTDDSYNLFFKKMENCPKGQEAYYLDSPIAHNLSLEEEKALALNNVSLEEKSTYSSESEGEFD